MNTLSLQIVLNNFFLITCIKLENGVFKISRTVLVKNLIIFPLFLVGTIFLPLKLVQGNSRHLLFNLKGMTVFLRLMLSFLHFQNNAAAACCVYSHIWKRKKILQFLNRCVKFVKFSNSLEDLKHFERKCRISYALAVFLMFFCCFLEFELLFYQTWKALFCYLFITRTSELLILAYFGFIHLCLRFLQFSFENLKTSFERDLKSSKNWKIERLLHRFISIESLLTEFNSTFGFVLSTMIYVLVTTLTIRVISV